MVSLCIIVKFDLKYSLINDSKDDKIPTLEKFCFYIFFLFYPLLSLCLPYIFYSRLGLSLARLANHLPLRVWQAYILYRIYFC